MAACSSGGGDTGGGNLEWLTPQRSCSADGVAGGPFVVTGGNYTLQNPRTTPFRYEFVRSDTWLEISVPLQGELGPNAQLAFQVTVGAGAAPVTPNAYTGSLTVLDAQTREERARIDVLLTVFDPSGWTPLAPGPNSRQIYVSSSTGSDANSGLSPQAAKATIGAGLALLRSGSPDWLYLMRGDEFVGGLGNWQRSGRSVTEPMVVTTYGTAAARPLLRTGVGQGMTVHGNNFTVNDVAFIGLHFLADTHNGSNGTPIGVSMLEPCHRVLIEDCRFERYYTNLVLQGAHTDLKIRRCVIVDAFTVTGGHSQGMYLDALNGCLIEECVIDHNGWSSSIAGANPNIFRHNIYVQDGARNVSLVGNVIARGSSHGAQMRPGGVIRNNVFLQNAINLLVGNSYGPNTNGVDVTMRGNVFLDGRDIDGANRRGWVCDFLNVRSGEVDYNIAAHQSSGTFARNYSFESATMAGISNLSFHHNVTYRWGAPVTLTGNRFTALTFRDNDVQEFGGSYLVHANFPLTSAVFTTSGNRFHTTAGANSWMFLNTQALSLANWRLALNDTTSVAAQVTYPRPDETIVEYDRSLPFPGPGTLDSFLTEARRQSRSSWRPKFTGTAATEYFRANFGVVLP